jgi:hypothetical protein
LGRSFFIAEWRIGPFQAGYVNRVVKQRSMIHRYATNIGPFTGKPEVNFSIADDPPGTDPSASWYRNSSFPLGAPITLALTWQLRPPNMAALSARAS